MKPLVEERKIPDSCIDLQEKVDILRWIRGVLKLLPHLPKGEMRSNLEAKIDALIRDESTFDGQNRNLIRQISELCRTSLQRAERIQQAKKPSSDEIESLVGEIRDLIHIVSDLKASLDPYKGFSR